MAQSIPFYNKTVKDTLEALETNSEQGLNSTKAAALLSKYGHNELEKEEGESIWEKIKEQFEDILVRILLLAALISFVISQFEDSHEDHAVPAWVEPAVIFTILICNAFVGIWQDLDAEKAISALKELQSPHALVLRDGKWVQIEARNLVPGDIVEVTQGDKVPADLRMVELKTITLKADQSILTGESDPVNKTISPISKTEAGVLDKINYLFSGTLINNGTAIAVVVQTGMNTEIGKIQKEVQDADKETKDDDSPLKKKINEFGDQLAKYISYICVICWAMNIPNFGDEVFGHWIKGAMYYFKVAVALAVAAIPEGLPAVITTCLALGTRRMAKKKAIIRKLPSVETLGCTTIICSDKTGTLTTNEMSVEKFFVAGNKDGSQLAAFEVKGHSYSPEGEIVNFQNFNGSQLAKNIKTFATSMVLNNESKLIFDKNRVNRSGLPTEAAIKVLSEKIGKYDPDFKNKYVPISTGHVEQYGSYLAQDYEKRATLEFSRDRKSMSVLLKCKSSNKNVLFIKGAPDYLLKASKKIMNKDGEVVDFTAATKTAFENQIKEYAKAGLRTLAICVKYDTGALVDYTGPSHPAHKQLEDSNNYAKIEEDPIIIGVVAVRDPPRPEVAASIQKCKQAGISVIMITGDIKETAESIARDIGIIQAGDEEFRSLTGHTFENLSEEKQLEYLQQVIDAPSGFVFSRTDPRHKRALVKILSGQNQIVAMTGDGVNDAPAIKQANIGIAMGISGTEVAKESSDMILSDDNFSTIVAAVEEGRAIYANMKAFIRYMISSNIGEVVSIFLSSLLGIPDGFNSVQLLWVNLVTDGLPATALSFNPADPDCMLKPPRRHDEPLISGFVFFRYLIIGTYVGVSTVFIFVYYYTGYNWADDGHPLIDFKHLRNWGECAQWKDFSVASFGKYDFSKHPCNFFTWGKQKPSTLSLTTLVVIEMFNALNALSDEGSLLSIGIFCNPYLVLAIIGSMLLHCMILYVDFFENIFNTVPLTTNDWLLVLACAFPVVILDEILKFIARLRTQADLKRRMEAQHNHHIKTD
ncbi:sarco/endoplasmic reticulum calcium-translocating P-type ATPase (macronuclear) [Tetrahymena thermophila SB210]|uniref:P-type Ca(2+) transporter n=1 Tax=Tetrahymena thermophila (strain SB210) TaxID=312017 RepID=Q22BT1_TETTS|nr:sarco/endoplasmic reticulum calcium-translocating P-type ATPase [Tetrahymena thermophila SB210]EAR82769.2 sarco/endoplasmic reticulum calcium-translocating P-type ATPase [Tetrahymena thermophila SB210]|eukprot:XP_001030432.2 sarco/endoplasmic reticulum calcium-translocating P-type ATPase [Tetrahymena thermophila SB210]